ncbi:Transposase, IS4 [Richelia intracellularis]|nr:Transposase, IS4 [Richelia intracellularis]
MRLQQSLHYWNYLDMAGCIITIDAMGMQTAIASQIFNAKANYVLGDF